MIKFLKFQKSGKNSSKKREGENIDTGEVV